MDFPDLRQEYFEGIHYTLSELFSTDYNDEYVISDNAITKVIYDIDVNFSVEVFDLDQAEAIQYGFDEEIDLIDAVHDNYTLTRIKTLDNPTVTIKKETPKSVGFPGYIQVISGSSYSYDSPASYFMATLDIDGEFYVFQLIGNEESMGYLYDDFIDILTSVEK